MIVISGYFGVENIGIYCAPQESECYFFSNNIALKTLAKEQGWTFIFCPNVPLSVDSRISSLQAKAMKFLQFDRALINAKPNSSILYMDHKFFVQKEHLAFICKRCNRDVLIRNSAEEKFHLRDEFLDAIHQKRYRETAGETLGWVGKKTQNGEYSLHNRIMNTGILYYKNPQNIKPLCDEVFAACWLLGQPECQIIWAILSQKYEKQITRVAWDELNPLWKAPTRREAA